LPNFEELVLLAKIRAWMNKSGEWRERIDGRSGERDLKRVGQFRAEESG
jgi:hypothetical protein